MPRSVGFRSGDRLFVRQNGGPAFARRGIFQRTDRRYVPAKYESRRKARGDSESLARPASIKHAASCRFLNRLACFAWSSRQLAMQIFRRFLSSHFSSYFTKPDNIVQMGIKVDPGTKKVVGKVKNLFHSFLFVHYLRLTTPPCYASK